MFEQETIYKCPKPDCQSEEFEALYRGWMKTNAVGEWDCCTLENVETIEDGGDMKCLECYYQGHPDDFTGKNKVFVLHVPGQSDEGKAIYLPHEKAEYVSIPTDATNGQCASILQEALRKVDYHRVLTNMLVYRDEKTDGRLLFYERNLTPAYILLPIGGSTELMTRLVKITITGMTMYEFFTVKSFMDMLHECVAYYNKDAKLVSHASQDKCCEVKVSRQENGRRVYRKFKFELLF